MLSGESLIQSQLIKYIQYYYPGILYCASAGGLYTSEKQGRKMKMMGYVKGFPDIQIFECRNSFSGLFIELKSEKGVIKKEQRWWNKELNERGYHAVFCFGFQEAREIIDKYLSGKISR
ncbi:VRR-NUC domain containing protein [uncultured Caudovirales phage]|uniref:VRR-NUC domain containing protein n=1 Tax=uncultured Caudovirales phage TaxID=2100421 RepID=A0A6J7X4H7_9CAUD|nr:VRR-NUC domain containing protein [uncultured Caudovirales phage]